MRRSLLVRLLALSLAVAACAVAAATWLTGAVLPSGTAALTGPGGPP